MKHIMQRHLEGVVTEAAGKLVFSLLSMLFIAAGLFYELEKYGVSQGGKERGSHEGWQIFWVLPSIICMTKVEQCWCAAKW